MWVPKFSTPKEQGRSKWHTRHFSYTNTPSQLNTVYIRKLAFPWRVGGGLRQAGWSVRQLASLSFALRRMTWAAACLKQEGVSLLQLLQLKELATSCVNSFHRHPGTGAETGPETPLWLAESHPTNSHTASSLSLHCIPLTSDRVSGSKSVALHKQHIKTDSAGAL